MKIRLLFRTASPIFLAEFGNLGEGSSTAGQDSTGSGNNRFNNQATFNPGISALLIMDSRLQQPAEPFPFLCKGL